MEDGYWIMRQSGNANVNVNFAVEPTLATPGEDYKPGKTMFTIHTADMMSFYATAVNSEGVVAATMVDPVTRYQYEMKLPNDFDYATHVGDLTIGSGVMIPTIRASSSGIEKPNEWDSYKDKNIFNISAWSHVITSKGILKGITEESSTKSFLEALGVEFNGAIPKEQEIQSGYFGNGGWNGNYRAIENSLIGKNATELTSLIDWSAPRYKDGVNEDNFFGIDEVSGATKTVQNSADGISGATVRISRESTSYQRALVEAGIIKEEDVIKGRF